MMFVADDNNLMCFSLATRGFYPCSMRAEYEAAGSWPDDAINVSADDELSLRSALTSGATISLTISGKWKIVAGVAPSLSAEAAPYLAEVRRARDAILNRLTGIGFAAMARGDADAVQAIAVARASLLDITICPSVVAALNLTDLQAAVSAECQRIAEALPEEARRAFDGTSITAAPPVSQ